MREPRYPLWHAGKEVAAGSHEAMLAARRLMRQPVSKPEPLPSYNLTTNQQLSEAIAIIRRQSLEIDNLKELVLRGDTARTNHRSEVERLRARLKEVEWVEPVDIEVCFFCGADKYKYDGTPGRHFDDCTAFTPEGKVK